MSLLTNYTTRLVLALIVVVMSVAGYFLGLSGKPVWAICYGLALLICCASNLLASRAVKSGN